MKAYSSRHTKRILTILSKDRIWSAYALADLEPEHFPYAEWHLAGDSLLLCYRGLEPPILFASGESEALRSLLLKLPAGEYQISFPVILLQHLPTRVSLLQAIPMWRMQLKQTPPTPALGIEVNRLGPEDQREIALLYQGAADAPDGYHPRQLDMGPFMGVRVSGRLIATAGIHVLSESHSLAALGNIYTHPDRRRQGLARACTTAVLSVLEEMGVKLIVLNVGQGNHDALALYSGLGFKIHCPFYEGRIRLTN